MKKDYCVGCKFYLYEEPTCAYDGVAGEAPCDDPDYPTTCADCFYEVPEVNCCSYNGYYESRDFCPLAVAEESEVSEND